MITTEDELENELHRALGLNFEDPIRLAAHVSELQAHTRNLHRRPRIRRRLVIGVSVAAALTLGAGAAVASPIHFPWEAEPSDVSGIVVFSSGDVCETAFTAVGDYGQPETYDEIMAAGKAGARYLATLDLGSLDFTAALQKIEAETPTDADGSPTAALPLLAQENAAVHDVVFEKMTAAVARQGYRANASLTGEAHCRKSGDRG